MHAPQAGRFPLFARAAAREALLEPGDVVFFPSRCAPWQPTPPGPTPPTHPPPLARLPAGSSM